jgi:DNA-binding winged helix-turn-helix (wHTH) protein
MIEQSSFGEHWVSSVFGPFRMDLAGEQLWRDDGALVALKPKTFAVLRYLTDHPGRLITKQELLDRLWSDMHVGDAVLKTQIREIRQALGDSVRAPRFIETAHRRGYRFICRVEQQRVAAGTARRLL